MRKLTLFVSIIYIWFGTGGAMSSADKMRILEEQLRSNNSRYVLPTVNGEPLVLEVLLELQQLIDLDVKGQFMSLNLWITIMWKNPYVSWDPKDFNMAESVAFFDNDIIWLPDLYFHEQTSGDLIQRDLKTPGNVWNDGYTTVGQSMCATFFCRIDGASFPFDEHTCSLTMESWNYFSRRLQLKVQGASVQPNENEAWVVKSLETVDNLTARQESVFGPMEYSRIQFHFTFRRRSTYHVVHILFPSVLISYLQLFIFVLPCESGEKVSFGVTIFLAQVVNMMIVNEHIPEGGKSVPLISQYLTLLVILNASALVLEIIILNLHFRFKDMNASDACGDNIISKIALIICKDDKAPKGSLTYENNLDAIDTIAASNGLLNEKQQIRSTSIIGPDSERDGSSRTTRYLDETGMKASRMVQGLNKILGVTSSILLTVVSLKWLIRLYMG